MGKTYRKDRKGTRRTEYRKKKEGHYKCRCEYCTSQYKIEYKEKVAEQAIQEDIMEYSSVVEPSSDERAVVGSNPTIPTTVDLL